MIRLRSPWPAAAALSVAALGCTAPSGEPVAATPTPSAGRLVFLAEPCPTCHGRDRMGTNVGPPIADLRGRWDESTLTRFLRAPAAFKQADPRLRQISERYRSDMPAFFSADERRTRSLVHYLLGE
ncbi:MAG TPA: c-type cytochrome [Thermoanaerobaculaceae bacterium]|nr:c-type cytochrome [Thermoanaerobaculaceae bacterium]